MTIKSYKNNIFEVITHLDKNDYDYFKNLTEEQLKEIQPYVLLKWLSTLQEKNISKAEYYTLVTNELVNERFWVLSKFKELQLQLLCATGSGQWTKHAWLSEKKKPKKDKKREFLRTFYSNLSDDEFVMKMDIITDEEIAEILHNMGADEK